MMKKRMSLLILVLTLLILPTQAPAGSAPVDDPPLFPRIDGYAPFSMEEKLSGVYTFYDGNKLVGVKGRIKRIWYEAPHDAAPIAPAMIRRHYADILQQYRGVLLYNTLYAGYPDERSGRPVLTGKIPGQGVETWVEVNPNGAGTSYIVTVMEIGGPSSETMAAARPIKPKGTGQEITPMEAAVLDARVTKPGMLSKRDPGLVNGPKNRPKALDMAEPDQPAPQRYVVAKGDTLWGISGKQEVYGDNMQWPLIFKANRDQIQDPDIIEIGQDLAISHEFMQEEVAQAIENAKRTPRYVRHLKPRKHLPIEY